MPLVPDLYRVQSTPSVNVIELMLPETVDAVDFDLLSESIHALLDGKTDQQWVIDLSAVSYLGSAMLGLIVNIRQKVKSGGGKLVLCGMSARLSDIFRMCSMERLFTITTTRDQAMKMLGR